MDATKILALRHAIEAVLAAHGFDVTDAGLGNINGSLCAHIDAAQGDYTLSLSLDVERTE
jgi:hypothetical protein